MPLLSILGTRKSSIKELEGGAPVAKTELLPAATRCLVLEDEFLIALDLQGIFEAAGAASVTCYATADEAMAALKDGAAFDFAVLDVRLGGADRTSLSVAAELTARKTPFIFLTGMRREGELVSAYRDVPVLEKPYRQDALIEAIRAVLPR
jgi:CheY-like chemotaxis protein